MKVPEMTELEKRVLLGKFRAYFEIHPGDVPGACRSLGLSKADWFLLQREYFEEVEEMEDVVTGEIISKFINFARGREDLLPERYGSGNASVALKYLGARRPEMFAERRIVHQATSAGVIDVKVIEEVLDVGGGREEVAGFGDDGSRHVEGGRHEGVEYTGVSPGSDVIKFGD